MDEEAGAIEGDPLRSGRRGPSPRVYRERGERFERGRAGGGRGRRRGDWFLKADAVISGRD
jgi:hypothetical protein